METNDTSGPYMLSIDSRFTTSPQDNGSPRPPSRSPQRPPNRRFRSATPYPRSSPSHHDHSPQSRSPARSGAPHRRTSHRQISRTSPYPHAPTSPAPRNSSGTGTSSLMLCDPIQAYHQAFSSDLGHREPSPSLPEDEAMQIPQLRATRVRPPRSFTYTRTFSIEQPTPRLPRYVMPGRFPKTPDLPSALLPKVACEDLDPGQLAEDLPRVRTRLVDVREIDSRILEANYCSFWPDNDPLVLSSDRQFEFKRQMQATSERQQVSSDEVEESSDTLVGPSSHTGSVHDIKNSYERVDSEARTQPMSQWNLEYPNASPNGRGAVAAQRTNYEHIVEMARREEERRARQT